MPLLRTLLTAAVSFSLAAAQWTKPTTGPIGNPVSKPSVPELIPAGKPYEITWQPTTEGTVTLLLLKGPSTNLIPVYPIAEKIENKGTFTWTPKTDLQDTGSEKAGYGIQIIVDKDGQYQWSAAFGITGGSTGGNTDSPTNAPTDTVTATDSGYPTDTVTATGYPTGTDSVEPTGSGYPTETESAIETEVPTYAPPTGGNGTYIVTPTGGYDGGDSTTLVTTADAGTPTEDSSEPPAVSPTGSDIPNTGAVAKAMSAAGSLVGAALVAFMVL